MFHNLVLKNIDNQAYTLAETQNSCQLSYTSKLNGTSKDTHAQQKSTVFTTNVSFESLILKSHAYLVNIIAHVSLFWSRSKTLELL